MIFTWAESKSPNEMKERDVEVLKQDSERVRIWCLVKSSIHRIRSVWLLGMLGSLLGRLNSKMIYMICNIDLSSG